MKGIFIPEITVEMFRDGCLESIETLMTEGEIYDIEYDPKTAEPEPPWIPCSERLPEVNDTYLVCYEDASVLMDWFNGHWFFYRTNPAVEETGTVIAWMPLPEPYQPEEESE